MNFSERILVQYESQINHALSRVCRIGAFFMGLAMLLNALHVFIISPIIYPVLTASIIIMLVPTILYDIRHIHNAALKYWFLTLLVFMSGILYAILSYHAIMMLVFPIVVSCMYCDRKCVSYTASLGVLVLIISHLIAYWLKIVPDEPLVSLYAVIVYGIVPRLIEYCVFWIIGISITTWIQKLIAQLILKNNEVYEDQQMLISSLSELVEVQSQETGGHIKRVAGYTGILCEALGYDKEDVWKISTASMMHDVGKLMIPKTIIEKPGKLTSEEYEVVKEHVVYGKRMLEKSLGEVMQIATVIAYQHHERYDGNGYMHMKGEEIDLNARIVSIADVFDALVSERPYKRAWLPAEAKMEIINQRGKQFDPMLVDLFEENYEKILTVWNQYSDHKEE